MRGFVKAVVTYNILQNINFHINSIELISNTSLTHACQVNCGKKIRYHPLVEINIEC